MIRLSLISITLLLAGRLPAPAQETRPESSRTLDSWVEEMRSDDPSVRGRAAMALEDLGPAAAAAAPRLLQILRDLLESRAREGPPAIDRLFGDAGRIPRGRAEAGHESLRRLGQVIRVLGALGPGIRDVVPALTETLQDCVRKGNAGRGTSDAATEELAGDAAAVLGRLGPAAAASAPDLFEALAWDAPRFRSRVIEALKMMPLDPVERVPECIRQLAEAGSVSRKAGAAWALSVFGPEAQAAVPALVTALRTGAAPLRNAAAAALAAIGPAAREAIPELALSARADPSLEAGAREAVESALRALAAFEDAAPEILEALAVAAGRLEVRDTAVETLARLAGRHEAARIRLVTEARASGAVFAALLRQDPRSKEFPHLQACVPSEPDPPADLAEHLDPEDEESRAVAWRAVLDLAAHGPGAAEAVPALRRLLPGEERLALLSSYALGRIGMPAAAVAVPGVTALLRRIGGRDVRSAAGLAGNGQPERLRLLMWVLERLGVLPETSGRPDLRWPGVAPGPAPGPVPVAPRPQVPGILGAGPVLQVDPALRVNDTWIVRPRQAPRNFKVVPLLSGGLKVEIDDDPHHLVITLARTASAAPKIDVQISTTDPARPGAPEPWSNVQGRVTTRNGVWIDRGPIELQFDVTGTAAGRRLRLEGGVVVDVPLFR